MIDERREKENIFIFNGVFLVVVVVLVDLWVSVVVGGAINQLVISGLFACLLDTIFGKKTIFRLIFKPCTFNRRHFFYDALTSF